MKNKSKAVNFLISLLISLLMGAIVTAPLLISEPIMMNFILALAVVGFWTIVTFDGLRDHIAYELKICGLTLAIACIVFLPLLFVKNANYVMVAYSIVFILVPVLISEYYRKKVAEDAKNKSNEMILSKRAAEWWCNYLKDSVDEEAINHFKRGLTNYLYRFSGDGIVVIASDCGVIKRQQESWGIHDGLLPENIVMYVDFNENEIWYVDVSGLEGIIV